MYEQMSIFDDFSDKSTSNLTERQKSTYHIIKRNSYYGRTTSQKELVDAYSNEMYKDGYVWNNNPKIHDHCSTIWSDINKINKDAQIHEIIIWDDSYNYKLAESSKEVEEFCDRVYLTKAFAKLVRSANLIRKVKRNGTYNLFADKSKLDEFWHTFLDRHFEDIVNLDMKESADEKD